MELKSNRNLSTNSFVQSQNRSMAANASDKKLTCWISKRRVAHLPYGISAMQVMRGYITPSMNIRLHAVSIQLHTQFVGKCSY